MSRGRKLGLSGLTSLSLDSLEAGVGSMTSSVHLVFYSYFFRTFRTLGPSRILSGRERIMLSLSQRPPLCREEQLLLRFLERGPASGNNYGRIFRFKAQNEQ